MVVNINFYLLFSCYYFYCKKKTECFLNNNKFYLKAQVFIPNTSFRHSMSAEGELGHQPDTSLSGKPRFVSILKRRKAKTFTQVLLKAEMP